MSAASPLRLHVEHALRHRIPGALSPRPRVQFPRVPTGVAEVDELLNGGLPLGAISELVGEPCSGRTSLSLGFAAEITASGRACAWIDVSDTLDPESAAAAGVDLARMLWVRCGDEPRSSTSSKTSLNPATAGPLCRESQMASPSGGGGSPHPRGEVRGMPEAIQAFLQNDRWCTSENPGAPKESPADSYPAPVTRCGEHAGEARRARKKIGTPGVPNRPLGRVLDREEQPPTDRMPSRRGAALHLEPRHPSTTMPHCAEPPAARLEARQPRLSSAPRFQTAGPSLDRCFARKQTWQALDQALRAADLLLAAGGFGALILDLGNTPPAMAWRIPLATWFRFRAAAERSRTAVVLLTQHPCARSSAELVLRLEAWQPQCEPTLLAGVRCEVAVARQRFESLECSSDERVIPIRKPPQSERRTHWLRNAAWQSSHNGTSQ